MEHFTKATKAEIQEKAFTMPEYELLLDLLPENVPMETVFYCGEFLTEEEIPKIVVVKIAELREYTADKYPFIAWLGLFNDDIFRDYLNYYFTEIMILDLPEDIVKGTTLDCLEDIYYRTEQDDPTLMERFAECGN